MLAQRYRTLGTGGIICLVLHYCALLCSMAICLSVLPLLSLFMLASIATLWLVNRTAFVLGILGVVAQFLFTGTIVLGFFLVSIMTDGLFDSIPWAEYAPLFWSILLLIPLISLAANILSLVFLLVKRRAFGVGVAPRADPTAAGHKDPWD